MIGYSFQDTVLGQNRNFIQNKAKTVAYQKVHGVYKQWVLTESLSAHSNTLILICLVFWHKMFCFYLQNSVRSRQNSSM